MPTTRKLYTLGDLKFMIAEKNGVEPDTVKIYEENELLLDSMVFMGKINCEDRTFVLQVDCAG